MTRLLLDYPWPLEAGLGQDPVPQNVIVEFLNLIKTTNLKPVPFIENDECSEFWGKLESRQNRNKFLRVMQFVRFCSRSLNSNCQATVVPTPPDIRDSWKRALRDELDNLSDWRNPQIAVPEVRRLKWPGGHEVNINCGACVDTPASGPHERVHFVLEEYDSHPFAIADLDPWSHLQWLFPPEYGARIDHPCILPKPPILVGVPLEELSNKMPEARTHGWRLDNKYYFIPNDNFRPRQVDKHDWRNGNGFERMHIKGWTGPCLKDYKDQMWRWDRGERHWDVETYNDRIHISHDGREV